MIIISIILVIIFIAFYKNRPRAVKVFGLIVIGLMMLIYFGCKNSSPLFPLSVNCNTKNISGMPLDIYFLLSGDNNTDVQIVAEGKLKNGNILHSDFDVEHIKNIWLAAIDSNALVKYLIDVRTYQDNPKEIILNTGIHQIRSQANIDLTISEIRQHKFMTITEQVLQYVTLLGIVVLLFMKSRKRTEIEVLESESDW